MKRAAGKWLRAVSGVASVAIVVCGWVSVTASAATGRYVPVATLRESDGHAGSGLSIGPQAVSADGSILAACGSGRASPHGGVYVFVRRNGHWSSRSQTAELTPSRSWADAFCGAIALSADGSTIAVGDVSTNSTRGAVFVFTRRGKRWSSETQAAILKASDGRPGTPGDGLGGSVAVSANGSIIASGAQDARVGGNVAQGAVYVFVRHGRRWSNRTQTAKLTTPQEVSSYNQTGSFLGHSVAMSADGSTIVAGADEANLPRGCCASQTGAVYVFSRPGRGWSNTSAPVAQLSASDGRLTSDLGYSLSASADASTIVAGDDAARAAYVFTRPGAAWSSETEQAKLTTSAAARCGALCFGIGIALSPDGSTVAGGVPATNHASFGIGGSVYLFVRPASGWSSATQTARLMETHAHGGDLCCSVALSTKATTIFGAVGQNSAAQGRVLVWSAKAP